MGARDRTYQEEISKEEENEETLSLCDLPLSGSDASDWNMDLDYSDDDQCRSNDDLFEFFTAANYSSPTYHPAAADNIIFCGKIIPYRESEIPDKTQILESKKNSSFEWKSQSFNYAKTPSSSKSKSKQVIRSSKSFSSIPKSIYKHGISGGVSSGKGYVVGPTEQKSRWYLLGMGRFPMEMELKDIKTRQSKVRMRQPMAEATVCSAMDGGDKMVKGGGHGKRRGKGLWRFLRRALGGLS